MVSRGDCSDATAGHAVGSHVAGDSGSATRCGIGVLEQVRDGHRPLAQAAAVAGAVPLAPALSALLGAFAANLVSAGVRLVPLGQTDGQRIVASLVPVVDRVAMRAEPGDLADFATATPLIEWCAMRHETQYTRLFRS